MSRSPSLPRRSADGAPARGPRAPRRASSRRPAAGVATLVLAALGVAGVAPTQARAAKTWNQASLWDFVDRREKQLDARWQEKRDTYAPIGNDDDVRLDANMLAVHAAAAREGHQGTSRHDDRVVKLADVLTRAPAFLSPPATRGGGQGHVPGWSSSTVNAGAQHVAIDPQVASALASAWEVRDKVGMPPAIADRIVQAISSVADSGFFKYPAMLLNQFNWQSDVQVAAAKVTGDPKYLADYRLQLERFVQGTRVALTPGRTAFLNAGLGLIYSPRSASAVGPALLSSNEYENLIYSGLRHYDAAIALGMAPLAPDDEDRLRQWGQRVLYGDWTHAGELNWDTSLGTRRWHLSRYWAFALQGAETLAAGGRLSGSPNQAAWAGWISERSLEIYDVLADRQKNGLLQSGLWGVTGRDTSADADPLFTASRFAAHAARLAQLGVGARKTIRPPSWFAWDPDVGRIAVSTKRYSTGILLRHPTDDIGGIEMSRLFGAAGEPASGTGGSARSAFGLDLAVGGKVVLDSEPGRHTSISGTQTLRLDIAGGQPLRGVFQSGLVVRGTTTGGAGSIAVTNRFDELGIRVERTVRSRLASTATVRLPAWGMDASILVVGTDGKETRLSSKAVPTKGVRGLLVRARRGGYAVGLCRVPAGARVRMSTIAPVPLSTSTKHVAQVIFPMKAGAEARIDVRLTPTIAAPQAKDLCG
ncbi:hypothetical protein [Patulibacter minatonensis]|uniref:hypothetical protein n=1 Tax=Patulibacter minatonensis TaxID=298163 RepID=UPI00047BDB60|nr:hypothetical protein [Patulibacter minatonensis]